MSETKYGPGSAADAAKARARQLSQSDKRFYPSGLTEKPTFDDTLEIPPLPVAEGEAPVALMVSFALCVLIPTLVIALYYFLIATPQYETEFRFEVMQGSPAVPGAPPPGGSSSAPSSSGSSGSSSIQGLTAMLGSQGSSIASAQNYVVTDYLLSQQAITDLEKRVNVRALYTRPGIDWLSRFNAKKSDEYFVKYWNKMVRADFDPMTGLATAHVRAFSARDAKRVADALVLASEDLVNNVVNKPNLDAVKAAEQQVVDSENRVKAVRARLAAFRSSAGQIDPTQNAVPVNIQLVETLRPNVIQLQSQLSAMKAQGLGDSPAAGVISARLAAATQQLQNVQNEVSKTPGGRQPLTSVVGRFEAVNFDVQFEQNLLDSALQTLAQTRAYALQQHLYIIPYVTPVLPQASLYPQRLQSTLLSALILFGIWLIGVLVVKAVRQHMD